MFSRLKMAGWGLAIGIASPMLAAQTSAPIPAGRGPIRIGVGYSYLRANARPGSCGCFNLSGGTADIAIPLWPRFSAVADLTGEHAGSTSVPAQSLSLVFFTAGPRFTYRTHRAPRYAPFVQGLVGTVHGFDGSFPTASSPGANSSTALAIMLGGGLDIAVTHQIAIRVFQADYSLTHLANNINNSENLLRVSAGIVLRR